MELHAVILVATWLSVTMCCSPEGYRQVHLDEMAHDSKLVVYGLVTAKFPNRDPMYDKAYSVEFEVKCIYKGGSLPAKINISDVGWVPGMCGDRNFTVGLEYIAFLSNYDGRYRQIYEPTQGADMLPDLLTFCGLSLDYPVGGSDANTCQAPMTDGCRPYKPTPPKPFPGEGLAPPPLPPQGEAIPEGSGDEEPTNATSTMESLTVNKTEVVVVPVDPEIHHELEKDIGHSKDNGNSDNNSDNNTGDNRDVVNDPRYGAMNSTAIVNVASKSSVFMIVLFKLAV